MKNSILMRTNLLVSTIIILGFIITATLSYQANYRASLANIEQISSLTSEGIYFQIMSVFTKPVNISLTMAHDELLIDYLANEKDHLDNPDYTATITNYLDAYRKQYGYDSVFFVSRATGRYYNFNGVDRVLTPDNPENMWFYMLLKGTKHYTLVVDNDEVEGASNALTIFVNCQIKDAKDEIIGVVGVGFRVGYLQQLLRDYEEHFGISAYLINENGDIEVSTTHTGYEKENFFHVRHYEELKSPILGWKKNYAALNLWSKGQNNYVASRYISELSWHVIVDRDTEAMLKAMRQKLYVTAAIIALVILTVLFVITCVIRNFNKKITKLTEESQEFFKKETEQLYDNIYELNITSNCPVGESTERYFESLGAPKGTPYDEGLRRIAEKQIKAEFREGYINTFTPKNVLREYERGTDHLQYDFMISQNGSDYFWMRIDARIFYCTEDHSIRMYTYRKNIDAEKRKEKQITEQARLDEMTGLYTKTATERLIKGLLAKNAQGKYAFFIFDIDNFKNVNDEFGHAFGDAVIKEFTKIIRSRFRKDDLIGRIGGDEFAAFIPLPHAGWATNKAQELSKALNTIYTEQAAQWKLSASIGVAIAPQDGTTFEALYRKADLALYETKKRGKNGYTVYHPSSETSELFSAAEVERPEREREIERKRETERER
ncbi:sensor domain-containing diguanylate cyclase, partial [uncultured Bilophila sp.]|uniref:sensor domain-containing diguanylate cyclase n=1 Tax=uncultured Bilophila sp. TaxID=529385 RepID=UPI002632BAA1